MADGPGGGPAAGDVRTAAFDDPRFEPERLRAATRAVVGPLERVTSDDELVELWSERLGRWSGPVSVDAIEAERFGRSRATNWYPSRLLRIPGGWGADVAVLDLDIATLRSVGADETAEAVVRMELRVRRWPRIPLLGPVVRALLRRRLSLWLTFKAPPRGSWELARIDFGASGEYHLAAETVPEPARDPALRDSAIWELAGDDAVGDPSDWIVSSVGDAGRHLLDLSVADNRFAPAVVEAAVRSLVRAWRRLRIGDEGAYHALAALSSYEIAEYARAADLPATVRGVEVVALVTAPRPALFLRIAALVQMRNGVREWDLWWKLELDEELEQHWRLVDAYARPELRALRG